MTEKKRKTLEPNQVASRLLPEQKEMIGAFVGRLKTEIKNGRTGNNSFEREGYPHVFDVSNMKVSLTILVCDMMCSYYLKKIKIAAIDDVSENELINYYNSEISRVCDFDDIWDVPLNLISRIYMCYPFINKTKELIHDYEQTYKKEDREFDWPVAIQDITDDLYSYALKREEESLKTASSDYSLSSYDFELDQKYYKFLILDEDESIKVTNNYYADSAHVEKSDEFGNSQVLKRLDEDHVLGPKKECVLEGETESLGVVQGADRKNSKEESCQN